MPTLKMLYKSLRILLSAVMKLVLWLILILLFRKIYLLATLTSMIKLLLPPGLLILINLLLLIFSSILRRLLWTMLKLPGILFDPILQLLLSLSAPRNSPRSLINKFSSKITSGYLHCSKKPGPCTCRPACKNIMKSMPKMVLFCGFAFSIISPVQLLKTSSRHTPTYQNLRSNYHYKMAMFLSSPTPFVNLSIISSRQTRLPAFIIFYMFSMGASMLQMKNIGILSTAKRLMELC
jgi:hypothetical protein